MNDLECSKKIPHSLLHAVAVWLVINVLPVLWVKFRSWKDFPPLRAVLLAPLLAICLIFILHLSASVPLYTTLLADGWFLGFRSILNCKDRQN